MEPPSYSTLFLEPKPPSYNAVNPEPPAYTSLQPKATKHWWNKLLPTKIKTLTLPNNNATDISRIQWFKLTHGNREKLPQPLINILHQWFSQTQPDRLPISFYTYLHPWRGNNATNSSKIHWFKLTHHNIEDLPRPFINILNQWLSKTQPDRLHPWTGNSYFS